MTNQHKILRDDYIDCLEKSDTIFEDVFVDADDIRGKEVMVADRQEHTCQIFISDIYSESLGALIDVKITGVPPSVIIESGQESELSSNRENHE